MDASTDERMREALTRLCGGVRNVARRVEVAAALGCSEQTLYQVMSRARDSKTGRIKGIGVQIRRKIDETFPGWLDPSPEPSAPNVQPGPGMGASVPLISWVAAGHWADVVDPYAVGDAEDWLPCPRRHGRRTFALRVEGQSMYNPRGKPSFAEGDIIFVDPDRDAVHGALVVVRLDDETKATFKRLLIDGDRRYMEALNPDWPGRIFPINGNATLLGVVIGRFESF